MTYTGNSQLSGLMDRRKVTNNPKQWLKQKQSEQVKNGFNINFFS
jgi:hypothetical protein